MRWHARAASAVAWTELGVTQRMRGEFKDAAASYQKAVEVDPLYAPAWRNLGVLEDLYLADPARALPAFEQYKSTHRRRKAGERMDRRPAAALGNAGSEAARGGRPGTCAGPPRRRAMPGRHRRRAAASTGCCAEDRRLNMRTVHMSRWIAGAVLLAPLLARVRLRASAQQPATAAPPAHPQARARTSSSLVSIPASSPSPQRRPWPPPCAPAPAAPAAPRQPSRPRRPASSSRPQGHGARKGDGPAEPGHDGRPR